tara:strand:+ start:5469 stop:6041 length:573 start_codon:yes stop_codon:yes gene_type:complete
MGKYHRIFLRKVIMNYQQCPVKSDQGDRLYSNVYIPAPNTIDERQKTSHIFFVDSRDVTKANDFQYDILMDTPFKNVHSIELKGLSFPKVNNEQYIIIDIDECKDRVESVDNSASHRSFAVCYFDKLNTGDVRPMRGADFDRKYYEFKPVVSKLGKLRISFRKYDGSVITPNDVNGVIEHTLLFEIITLN